MDLTDIPNDVYDGEESPPDFDEVESSDSLLKRGQTRERLLDVVITARSWALTYQ